MFTFTRIVVTRVHFCNFSIDQFFETFSFNFERLVGQVFISAYCNLRNFGEISFRFRRNFAEISFHKKACFIDKIIRNEVKQVKKERVAFPLLFLHKFEYYTREDTSKRHL